MRSRGAALCGLLLAAVMATPLRADLEYPRLLSITRESPANAKLGDVVSYRFTIQPGTAPTTEIACVLVSAQDVQEIRSTNIGSGLLSVSITEDWVNGPYMFLQITLTDSWGRTVRYSSEELSGAQVVATPAQPYAGPSTHSFSFAGLALQIEGASAVLNASQLVELTPLTTAVLSPGGVARFRYVIKPGATPWSRLTLAFRTQAGLSHTVFADLTTPTGEIAIPILAEMANGRYDYSSVQLGGPSGTVLLYGSPTVRTVIRLIGTLSFATGLDYFNSSDSLGFSVTGASATATVALLSSWTREGGAEFASGSSLKFNFATTAGPYGVRSVQLRINGPYGGVRNFVTTAASGTFTVPVEADWTPGPYTVSAVSVVDNAGRSATYATNGSFTVAGGTRPTTTHPFPNEGFEFTVQGTPIPAYFVLQPVERIAAPANTQIQLRARAVGLSATTTYAWYRGEPGDTRTPITTGVSVNTVTGIATLTVTVPAAVAYWVRATNGGQTVDSVAARVVIAGPPTISVQPVDQAVPIGGTALFSVTADGEGPFTYAWRGFFLPPGTDTTQRTLQVKVTSAANSGLVSCTITGPGGSVTSREVLLGVPVDPTPLHFTAEAADRAYFIGDFISLDTSFVGNPPYRCQWQKDGVDVGFSEVYDRTRVGSSIAWGSSWRVERANAQTAGVYRLTVSNGSETIYSREIRLTLTSTAVFDPQPPARFTAVLGGPLALQASVRSQGLTTYQWRRDGVAIPGATTSNLNIDRVTAADVGTYELVATNANGSVTSGRTVVAVQAGPSGQLVQTPPSQTVAVGATVTFTASISGDAYCTWTKDDYVIYEGPGATLTLRSVGVSDAGSYTVAVHNTGRLGPPGRFSLAVNGRTTGAPTITRQPVSMTAAYGQTVWLSVGADGPGLNYRWRRDGQFLSGAEARTTDRSTIEIPNFNSALAGTYDAIVSSGSGSVTSAGAVLSLPAGPPGERLTNVSVRTQAGGAAGPLIVGFVTSGGTGDNIPLLVRAAGPALTAFGVGGALVNPVAQLYAGPALRYANDDWTGFPGAVARGSEVGAFPFTVGSRDAVMLPSLPAGGYTVYVTSADAVGGVALAEIYDATPLAESSPARPRLVNLSVQTKIDGSAAPLTVGFVLRGQKGKRVLVRAIGPSLGAFGVQGTLTDPRLALFSGQTRIAENEDWGGEPALRAAFDSVGAFALPNATSKDGALVATLAPGPYTVQVGGPAGATGIVLVEIYELP